MSQAAKRTWLFALFVLNLFIMLGFFWHVAAVPFFHSWSGALIGIGNLCGILGSYLILVQVLMTARIPWLEQALGMQRLLELHHENGELALALILVHPVFLLAGNLLILPGGLWHQIVSLTLDYPDVVKAELGTGALVLVVGLSITMVKRHLNYEFWYFIHLLTYVAILFAFFHQVKAGQDFVTQPLYQYYWWGLYLLTAGLIIWYRVVGQAWRWWRHRFVVERVVAETPQAVSIYVGGRGVRELNFRPGQFAIWRFVDPSRWWQAHPFSLSWSPDHDQLRLTASSSGSFTAALPSLAPGTPVIVDGPHGDFVPDTKNRKFLLIAGGAGITPLRSMAEVLAGRDIVLLYACRAEQAIIFRTELQEMQRQGRLRLAYFFSEVGSPIGTRGYIDATAIRSRVPDAAQREVYVCGPPPMMDAVTAELAKVGVPDRQIHTERFSF